MVSLTVSDYYVFSAKYHSKRILAIDQHLVKFTGRSMMAASLRHSSHLHHPVHSPLCLWSCSPLPSDRHHRSNGECLEGKMENYQVCSVQYCVQQLCTVQCTHTWTDLTVLWIGFCLTGPMSLLRFIFVCVLLCVQCMHVYCVIVTWWGGIEAYPQDYYFLQCFDTVGWVIWPVKSRPDIWPIMCLVGR